MGSIELLSLYALFIFFATLLAQLLLPSFTKALRWITITSISGLVAILSYYSALQYFVWLSSGVARYLIPPYQSINYFAFYALTEFWANYLLAAALGTLGYLAIKRQIKKGSLFFYPEEPLLALLATTLVGHSLWIAYLPLLLIAAIIGTLWTHVITKTKERISFRYLWLPVAMLIMIASPLLNKFDFFIYLQI